MAEPGEVVHLSTFNQDFSFNSPQKMFPVIVYMFYTYFCTFFLYGVVQSYFKVKPYNYFVIVKSTEILVCKLMDSFTQRIVIRMKCAIINFLRVKTKCLFILRCWLPQPVVKLSMLNF